MRFEGRPRDSRAHRVIVALTKGEWPDHEVDHENQSKSDNRPANLREATQPQNAQNASLRSDNTSGVKGVNWDKQRRKWRMRIWADGYEIRSHHDTFEEARDARWAAESALHPFRVRPKPLDPMKIIPDGALVTGVYRFDTKPKRVTYTYIEAS